MNTPAHLIIGAAAFARPGQGAVTAAALVGALLPDASLYLMAGASIFLLGIPPQIVFDELYFSEAWQTVFAIDNSLLVWGAILLLGLVIKRTWILALSGAALAHILLDLPLHHDDGRPHFWPASSWVFESPVSYWDSAQYAGVVAPIGVALSLALTVVLIRRFRNMAATFGFGLLCGLEIWVARQWILFF